MDSARMPTPSVAVAQIPAVTGGVDANLQSIAATIRSAGEQSHDVVVFSECSLSGYLFVTAEQTRAAAIRLGDPRIATLVDACAEAGVTAVVGLVEEDAGQIFNTSVLMSPSGVLGSYRKQHLPFLGADRFVAPGTSADPCVIDTEHGRIGMMICFDLRFPEAARGLALRGADLIAMPTAWPDTAHMLADHFTRVRAVENLVHLAVADRAGAENGTPYLGGSQVVAPSGEVLVRADGEGIFAARIDVAVSRTKHLVNIPGEYELAVFDQRKPGQYAALTEPQN